MGPRHLDWIVESELVEVSAKGRDLRSLGVRRRGIGTFRTDVGISFLHRIFSPMSAYYRADIRFYRKGTDRFLGQYSFYVRMMKPRVDLRVRIDTPTVSPGQFAKAALLNLGTVPLVTRRYDYGFGVQTFTGENWIRVRDNPSRTLKRLGHWVLPAGVEDPCRLRYLVPRNQPPAFSASSLMKEKPKPKRWLLNSRSWQVLWKSNEVDSCRCHCNGRVGA